MNSIFEHPTNAQIINRINALTPHSPALWGRMNVGQMLAHCQPPIQIAFGKLELKRQLFGILFGGLIKKQWVKNKPLPKNSPTFKEATFTGMMDFETEKQKLIAEVEQFVTKGKSQIISKPHPFFGKMTVDEWDALQYKHLDHHLTQFGV